MKTIILLGIGFLPPAVVASVMGAASADAIPVGSLSAVAGLSATLLLMVGKYMPTRDKLFADTITKIADNFADTVAKLVETILKERE